MPVRTGGPGRDPETVDRPSVDLDGHPEQDLVQHPSGGAGARGWRQRMGERHAAAAERLTPWPQSNRWGTRALLVLLLAGVAAGPVALVRSTTVTSVSTPTAAPPDTASANREARARTQAEGAASRLVWSWLSASQADADTLSALLKYPPAQLNLPRNRPRPPSSVTVLDATVSTTSWTVTVAATGGDAGSGATYQVGVQVDDQGATPLTLPGQIPSPRGADARRSRDEGRPFGTSVASADPAAAAAGGFVQTLLSGSGDLSRWTSPGSDLSAVRPAPCSTLQTATSARADPPEPIDGQSIDVLVAATCHRGAGATTTDRSSQYLLTLTARGGRWEVSAYTNAPSPAPDQAPAAGSGTPGSPTGPDPDGSPVPNDPGSTSSTSAGATPR